jgi:hypothetical protein
MKWGWVRVNEHHWRFSDVWSVIRETVSRRWYVRWVDGCLLRDHANDADAIAEAERLMDQQ